MKHIYLSFWLPFFCIVGCSTPIANTQTSKESATETVCQLVKESLSLGDDSLLRELLFPPSPKLRHLNSLFNQIEEGEFSFIKATALIQAARYCQYQTTLFEFYHGLSQKVLSIQGNHSGDDDREQVLECISHWSEVIENGSLDVKKATISLKKYTASVCFYEGEALVYTLSLEKRWTPEYSFFWIVSDYSIGAIF